MSYTRKFKRNYDKVNEIAAEQPKSNVTLSQRIVAAVTAAGFVLNPMAAMAAIIRGDGTTVNFDKNNVANVWAEKVVGNAAVNVFDQYKVNAGQIANMYFKELNGKVEAQNLVNFVNSRIDVNGTVNAVQNSNKIGGNMFFLSKDGMAVGKSGVINTGSLYVMTPTETFMKNITGDNGKSFDEGNFNKQWDNIQKMQIPVNASGTITVLGKVNAANNVQMMAANIAVGRNNTEEAIDGVVADAVVKEATIQTGISDFSNIVNIKNADGSITDAGLANELKATVDAGSGDIVLRAVASDVNSEDPDFAKYASKNQAKATVVVDGTVAAKKDASITAEAISGTEFEKLFGNEAVENVDQTNIDAYGRVRKNVAVIDINGNVSGQHVDIQAKAANSFVTGNVDENTNLGIFNDVVGLIGPNLQGGYGVIGSEAIVNVNENAVVKATASKEEYKNALNISADSRVKASIGAGTAAVKLANIKGTGNVPATAVSYAETTNAATVNIKGKLQSDGNTNISAYADSTLEAVSASDTTQLAGDQASTFNIAVLVAKGKNSSAVNIEKGAALTATDGQSAIKGDLDVSAVSQNSVDTSAIAAGKEKAVASTAVNVTTYDSSANVNIDADLKAENIDIKASNTVSKNNVTADNSVGGNMIKQLAIQKATNTWSAEKLKDLGKNLKQSFFGPSTPDAYTVIDKLGDNLGVGASVSVAKESNTAKVKIGSGAQIVAESSNGAKGDINITAKNVIEDTQMGATGVSSNYDKSSEQKVIINASVLYADMDNNATVEVSGEKEVDGVKVGTKLTGKNVNVADSSEFQYNRVERMINDLLALCNKLENAYASNENYKKNVQELQKLAEDYKKNAAGNPDYLNSDDGLAKAAALAAAAGTVGKDAAQSTGSVQEQIQDIVTGPFSVLGAVVQFANPDNYVNFRTGSSTGGKDDGAKASVAGSANVTYLTNNSSVLIGKNAVIDAAEAADLKANVKQKDVSLVGKLLTGGGDTSVGGNVNLYFGDTNSLIVVGEGAKISGGAINIISDNDINHTGVTYGAGKGGETGVTGMVNVMQGDSNSLISIDDEATLIATGTETYEKDPDKKDDEQPEDTITGKINIKSTNNTTITNVAGTAAMADTAAVGIGVAVNMYNVNNKVAIADNDIDNNSDDEDKKVVADILKANLSEDERKAVLGTVGVDKKADAEISGSGLEVKAESGGTINAIGVAGSAVMGSDYDEPGIGDKFNAFKENMISKGEGAIDAIDGKIQGLFGAGGTLDGVGNASQGSNVAKNPNAGQKLPSFTVSGAGSNATNIINGDTSSVIDGVTINMKDQGAVKAGAVDDSFIGAWAGSAAVNWKTTVTQQNWNNKSVGIAGAVAVNQADVDVKSIIKNATINNAGSIINTAEKNGALVAAGIGGNFSKDASGGGGKKYTGAASVSVNLSENNVEAALENNTIANNEGKTNLTNDAYNNDTQVTGGVNANLTFGGDNANSIGAAVSVADITNNVTSKISGGTYTNMGDMAVNAVTDITQVGAAVGIGVSTAQDGNNLQGNAAYNQLTNNVVALVDGVANINTDSIAVKAYDTDKGEKKHDAYINARGLDATGAEYQKNVSDAGYEDGDEIFNDDGSVKAGQTGNKIITAALSIAGSANKGNSGAAAVSINDINNDFTAKVNGATITANGNNNADKADVDVHASSNTLMVNVAAGGAGSSQGFGGAGSVSWQTLNNDITAAIENSTITAGKTAVTAASGALGVNVAGQVAVGKNAVGLALAYNAVENNTGAYVKGSEIKNDNDEETELTVKAVNTGKIYAVGAGVTASTEKIALNGSIAINRGNNNVEAIIDDYTDEKENIKDKHTVITNAKKVEVETNDSSTSLAVVGSVTVGKKAAAGGAVAYNEIGNISGKDGGKVQNNTAQIKNAQITAAKDAQISVNAIDTAKLTTAAVGAGVNYGGGVAVQGAAATALINKDTVADMTGVTITKAKEDEKGADVTVQASSNNNILTTADVVAVSAGSSGAAMGAGVAVNRSEADVTASVNGGQQTVNNLRVDAANNANITTIGVGGSVAGGTGASITGSVAVNQIGNNTAAKIAGGANITADNNVIVDAISDEQIANYAGALSVAATGAAIGASVSVNQIDGATNALIEGNDTSVTAYAKGEADNVKDTVNDEDILDNVVDEDAFDAQKGLADKRKDSAYSGVAVSASSTHGIKSFLVNVGVAGKGAAVSGNVNVNTIGGSTTAAIRGADINKGVDFSTINNTLGAPWDSGVNVVANDYTNSAGIVGTVAVAGIGAGVGLGSDTNTVSRDVTAQVMGKGSVNDKDEYITTGKNEIKASQFKVAADAQQGISSLTVSGGVAGEGAGVGNATSVALLKGNTTARVDNAHITAGGADVIANHTGRLNTMAVTVGGAGLGVGAGIGVSVLNENSTTNAEVTGVDIDITDDSQDVNIEANNLTQVNYQLYSIGGGAFGGVAGSVGVSNINSKVNTVVKDTEIGSADGVHKLGTTQVDEPVLDENGNYKTDDDGNPVTEKKDVELTSADKANNINISGTNTVEFINKAGTGAAGAGAAGVGVAINTIDSQVNTSVENSHLYAANDINVTAAEKRTADQMAVNASAGAGTVGANVMITNVGKAVESAYGDNLKTDKDGKVDENGGGVDIGAIYTEANDAVNGNKFNTDYTYGGVGENDAAAKTTVTAGKGGGQESIVKVKIDSTTLDAGNKVSLKAEEDTNVKMDGIQATAGAMGSLSGTVGIMDVHRNSGVEVIDTKINAKDLAIDTLQKGKSDLNIYQGTAGGGLAIGAAYGEVNSEGKTGIGITGSKFNVTGDIDINAKDQSRTEVDAIGVTLAGGGAASVIIAQGTNDAETTITVDKTAMNAGNDVDINAERKAKDDNGNDTESLSVEAHAGSGGLLFAGAGVSAIANEYGTVGVDIKNGNTLEAGRKVNVTAKNAPSISARTTAATASLLASAAVTHAQANIGSADNHLNTYVKVGGNNIFVAGSGEEDGVNIKAEANAKQKVDMLGISVSANPSIWAASVQANVGGADVYSDVTVDVADGNTFRGETYKASDTEYKNAATNVTIEGTNSVTQDVTAQGISVSTGIASGTNLAETNVNLVTTVKASGSTATKDGTVDLSGVQYKPPVITEGMTDAEKTEAANKAEEEYNKAIEEKYSEAYQNMADSSSINNLTVKGGSNADITSSAIGNGGGLVDVSPNAAELENTYNATTDVTLSGSWNTDGAVDVTAMNGAIANLKSDAVRAAVVGGSGVWLDNTINNTANVNVTGATVTSGGKQSYNAENNVEYTGKVDGSGYGGLNINGSKYEDDLDFTANVNITGSKLTGVGDKGAISAEAITTGSIDSVNSLKSAGVIPVSVADSDHAIDYNNAVTVNNSELLTKKKDQNITLAASDNTTVDLEAIADTQGGVVGAASSNLDNAMNRTNKVTVSGDTKIESANDVNLYAGADANGKYAGLDISVIADAYNKTALPVALPSVNNTMSQTNQVEAGGDVGSVRHINAKAVKGNTIILKSARTYNVYTQNGGTGSIATTDDGSISDSDEKHDNYINVTGNYKSGIHNKLTLNISGSTKTDQDSSKVDYSGIKITADKGNDWFNVDDLKTEDLKLANNLLEAYRSLETALKDYKEGTTEYTNLTNAMKQILDQMKELNFVEMKYNQTTEKWEQTDKPAETINVLGIVLPDIIVSGGNINLESDNLKGSGSLTAQGAPQVTITNSSDLYLKVNDVAISGKGGKISFNEKAMSDTDKQGFSGGVVSDTALGETPKITIHSTSASKFVDNPLAQPDIGVVGNITNTEGDIEIKSDNHNIVISDKASVSGQNVQLIASNGSVSQTSPEGVINVGGDPISQYQFGEEVAKRVQKYLNDQLKAAHDKNEKFKPLEFDSYDAYLKWLVDDVKISPADLNIMPENFGQILIKDYDVVTDAVRKQLCKDMVEADGKKFNETTYKWFPFYYAKYTSKINDNMIDDEIKNHQTDAKTWYSYLANDLGLKNSDVTLRDEAIKGSSVIDKSSGILAGKNVYINALQVNINGLVQAGYGDYSVKLDETADSRIDDITTMWNNGGPLTDSEVMGNANYLVNGVREDGTRGGEIWNAGNNIWEYEVKVYYNPYTKKLLVDNVNPGGGQIYINGAVSSTGNGRIMAMDGMADIDINTQTVTNKDVTGIVVNEITNKDIEGLVSITDTNKKVDSQGNKVNGLVTEYKNGQWREYEYGHGTNAGEFKNVDSKDFKNGEYTYNPVEDLRYQYTGGYESGETNYWSYKKYFMFWNALTYSSTDDFINKIPNKDAVVKTNTTSSDGDKIANGVYIGKGNTGGNNDKTWYITGEFNRAEEKPSGTVAENKEWGWHESDGTKDPDWVGKMFGYGRVTYSWVTKNTTSSTTTSSIKADKPITIGFIGKGNNEGKINITGNQNIELAGSVSNATIGDKGAGNVNITSNKGNIVANSNAYITSDDVTLKAATGIDVNHLAIDKSVNGNGAKIDIATDKGNINFVSKGGNLNVVQAVTGGNNPIDGSTGNVAITAEGSMLNAATGEYAIKGQRIDLVSNNGTIGTKDKAMTILAGSEMYSGNSMDSSVNAKASGDIVLTQVDGNMRLGSIETTGGDAVLTVTNGSFVDAYNADNLGYSDTADKVDRWLEHGLISDKDDAGDSAKAAEQAKNDRLAGLEDRANTLAGGKEDKVNSYKEAAGKVAEALKDGSLQEAKYTYTNAVKAASEQYSKDIANANGDEAKIADINKAYTAKQKELRENYMSAQAKVYGDGFTTDEQQLIASYAEVAFSDNYGWSKNQLLYAIQSDVVNSDASETVSTNTYANVTANNITLKAAQGGIGIDGNAKTISYDNLNDVENLKVLAASKAGDLEWKDNEVVVRQQKAINIKVNKSDGQVDVTGKNNVYLAGIKDSTLNVSGITTENDIKLQADNGVHMVGNDSKLAGNNLTITGGAGSIGTREKHVDTQIHGWLEAKASGDIYIDQIGDLNILSAGSESSVNLTATGNMLMADYGKNTGYINAEQGVINLKAGGNIGTSENGIRVKNSGATLNADAGDNDIYLDAREDGTLVLDTVKGNSLTVKSEGSITQDETAGSITANTVDATTAGSQQLISTNNKVNKYNVHGLNNDTINGSVDFVTNTTGGLNVQLGGENGLTVNNGNVSIKNLADKAGVTVKGSVTTTGGNDADGDVNFISQGSLTNEGVINSANNVAMNAVGAITQKGSVTAENNATFGTTTGEINLEGDVTANAGDVVADTKSGAINVTGSVTAGTDVNVTTGSGAITTTGGVNAGTNVNVTTGKGAVELGGTVNAETGNVNVHSGDGKITTTGDVTAKTDTIVTTDNGEINLNGKVTATEGNVDVKSENGAITTGGAVTAGQNATVTTGSGAITLGGDVLAQAGEILAKTNTGNITVKGNATANTNAGFTSGSGNINVGGNVTAETGKVTAQTGSGNINVTGNVSAEKEADFTVEKDGSITLGGTTKAEDINAKVTVDGNITFTGAVNSTGGNVTANVGGTGNIETGEKAAVNAEKDISFTTNNGSITTNSSLNAGNSVGLTTNTGDIVANDAITAEKADVTLTTKINGDITTNGAITAADNFTANTNTGDIWFRGDVSAQQNINVNVNTQGKISTSDDGSGDGHTGAKLEAINGNMNIQSKLGDIDMHELYAKDKLDITANNGNINICKINGEIVTIVLKTPGTKQHVDNITAGSQIVLEGSDIDLDNIERRVGSDGMLIISPKGNDDQPMNEFNIGSINSSGGIRLSQLWAKNSKIKVLEGKFYIDKLFIENEAHFSRGNFTTAVYGKAPVDDGSNSIFWNNPKYNPAHNLDAWKDKGQNGFYFLNFEEHPYVQRSNMALVHLDDYYYVYNQRFAGVNHARYLEGDGLYELYQLADEPSLVYYNRYYNYDLPEMAHNADEDELVIESEKV